MVMGLLTSPPPPPGRSARGWSPRALHYDALDNLCGAWLLTLGECSEFDPENCHKYCSTDYSTTKANSTSGINCPKGTFFNSERNQCQLCTSSEDSDTKIETQCSQYQDTVFKCLPNSNKFLQKTAAVNCSCIAMCVKCSVCGVGSKEYLRFMIRNCTQSNDAVCCAHDDDIVPDNKCIRPGVTLLPTTERFAREEPANGNNILWPNALSITTLTIFHLSGW
ncbi:hypothetical protein Btru_041252 [Bulinus truncatus]|nr:hypothetical protein Btru_041252 [Bulinus truncatus]